MKQSQRNTKQLLYGSLFDIDSFIEEEVHKTYPEIELEVVPYSGEIQQPVCRIC